MLDSMAQPAYHRMCGAHLSSILVTSHFNFAPASLPSVVRGTEQTFSKPDIRRAPLSAPLSVRLLTGPLDPAVLDVGDAVRACRSVFMRRNWAFGCVSRRSLFRMCRSFSLYSRGGGGLISGLGRTFSNALIYILLPIKLPPRSRTSVPRAVSASETVNFRYYSLDTVCSYLLRTWQLFHPRATPSALNLGLMGNGGQSSIKVTAHRTEGIIARRIDNDTIYNGRVRDVDPE